jgi:PAS domain S-box
MYTGEKLPQYIGDLVQKVFSQNVPEKMEVKVGKITYLVEFYPILEEESVDIYGFDISDQKDLEARLLEAYEEIRTQSKELQDANEQLQTQSEDLKVQSDELLEAYELLQDRENEVRTLSENSPDLIARFDRQNHCLYANPAFIRFYCRPPPIADFYGWSASECIDKIQVELQIDPELVKLSEKQHANVFFTGEPEKLEFHYITPKGQVYYFDTKIVPEFDDGKVKSVLVVSRDITELKEAEAKLKGLSKNLDRLVIERTAELQKAYDSLRDSEERFRALVTASSEVVYIMNPDWREMNQLCGRGFIADTKNPSQSWLQEYILPEDQPHVIAAINEAIRTKNTFELEHQVRKADGSVGWVLSRAVPLLDANGEIVEWFGAASDITERRQAEEALAKIESARKQEIHHRIKNNLQVISSLLDLQAEKFRDKECIKDSEVLEAFRESQDRVISMALIHEELYKGGESDTLDFSSYMEELADNLFLTYRLGNENICLNLDFAENTFFDMDIAVPLGMIVNELVNNSLKYAFLDKKEGRIQIKLSREEDGECITNVNEDCTTFVLNVSDNGGGIPESLDLEDVNSLGIQLVTSLVDQLDGELELKRNNGTEFIIRFTAIERNNQILATSAKQLME